MFYEATEAIPMTDSTSGFALKPVPSATRLAALKKLKGSERSLAEVRHRLGDDHPETVELMARLGLLYRESGAYAEAIDIQAEVVDCERTVHGDDSGEVVNAKYRLALTHRYAGDYVSALVILEGLVKIVEGAKGKNHEVAISVAKAMTGTLYEVGNYEQLESIQREIVARSERVFGKCDTRTLESTGLLADALRLRGNFAEALVVDKDLLREVERQALGPRFEINSLSGLMMDLLNLGEEEQTSQVIVRFVETALLLPREDPDRKELSRKFREKRGDYAILAKFVDQDKYRERMKGLRRL